MDDFLTKPVAIEALRSALAKWLSAACPAPAAAQPTTELKPLDATAFAVLVEELRPLLQHNKFAAISRYAALQALVARTPLAEEIDALNVPLQEMRFDFVLERLLQIASAVCPPASEGPP
jgi:hypothetical protein